MPKLTQERLKQLLLYDPSTGVFNWKANISTMVKANDVAGSIKVDGYRKIKVDRKLYMAHRLAWLYMEGFFPVGIEIDHKDQNKLNNRWENLRLASVQCNQRNRGNPANNTSGVKGVSWCKRSRRWQAGIGVNKNHKNIGHFKSFDEAVLARLAAEQCLDWEGCDSNSPAYKYAKENIL